MSLVFRYRLLITVIVACALLGIASTVGAQEPDSEDGEGSLHLGGYTGLTVNQDEVFHELGIAPQYSFAPFYLSLDFAVMNSEKYVPAQEEIMLGYYFDFREGTVGLESGRFDITVGRARHEDEVASPYSVMISSAALPSIHADVSYDDGRFFYRTRWIELNRNSQHFQQRVPVYGTDLTTGQVATDPPLYSEPEDDPTGYYYEPLNRGANYKAFGIHLGDWRFAFQETVVYLNQSFHPEYFLSPLPMYFTQLANSDGDKPWVQRSDENSLMGVMADVQRPDWYAYGQFLLDDINLNALTTQSRTQPQKWAWSFGGWKDTDRYGKIGLYHAGSTQYTFQATSVTDDNYSLKRYEYSYWPAVEYPYRDGTRQIDYRDNYMGYLYGENNLALMATWDMQYGQTDVGAQMEATVSGTKSPANPWAQYDEHPGRRGVDAPIAFYMFEDGEVETTVRTTGRVSRRFGRWEASAEVEIGYRWNELILTDVDVDDGEAPEPRYYAPIGEDQWLFSAFVGLRYAMDLPLTP